MNEVGCRGKYISNSREFAQVTVAGFNIGFRGKNAAQRQQAMQSYPFAERISRSEIYCGELGDFLLGIGRYIVSSMRVITEFIFIRDTELKITRFEGLCCQKTPDREIRGGSLDLT